MHPEGIQPRSAAAAARLHVDSIRDTCLIDIARKARSNNRGNGPLLIVQRHRHDIGARIDKGDLARDAARQIGAQKRRGIADFRGGDCAF